MFDTVLQYYGLDWASMIFGMTGCYLITQQNRLGFIFNIFSCIFGFLLATISNQYGLIFYNVLFVFMMIRGYNKWAIKEHVVALGAE